jgi:hypothetical protein
VPKLLEHFKAMQTMCAAYIEPTPTYTSRDGRVSPVGSLEQQGRDRLFIDDMVYMLDGPEQREAQAEFSDLRGWHLPSLNEGLRLARVINGYPLPGDMDLNDPHAYPTMDAFLAANRALHWRTEQLRQAGIEPLDLSKLEVISHYPPEDFRFPITEAFPKDDHRQLYHAWRRYPRAMRATMALMLMVGLVLGLWLHFVVLP